MRTRLRLRRTRSPSPRYSLVVVTVALAVILFVLAVGRIDEDGDVGRVAPTDKTLIDSLVVLAVNDFGAFVAAQSGARDERLEPANAAEGIRHLADVLDALLLRVPPDSTDYGRTSAALREDADLLLRAAAPAGEARIARGAFMLAADAVSAIQRDHYGHLERASAETTDAAHAIRVDTSLTTQRHAVQHFFERAYDVLRAMSGVEGSAKAEAS